MQELIAGQDILLENIVPFYQPIYALKNKRVDRYECLARLMDKEQIVSPDGFLYLLEGNHESCALTSRILELSSAYCKPRQINWSVNLFASDLNDKTLINNLKRRCLSSIKGLCGVDIKFDCVQNNITALAELRKEIPNLHITIDDIHECSSALLGLFSDRMSAPDAIKIKADAIKNILNSEAGTLLFRQLQELCTSHSCKLIAEHIEDAESLEAVLKQDIVYGQGFYLSLPVPKVVALQSV